MKKSILLLSKFTAINGHTHFSLLTEQKRQNKTPVVGKSHNLLGAINAKSEMGSQTFRQKMNAAIESNSQKLSLIRQRIKNENKQSNADISTTIFELELANGYMKIKLENYTQPGQAEWEIFKKEFSTKMNDWNIEFTDFVSTI
jgi:hypothetical protein